MAELLFYLSAAGAVAFAVGVVVARMPLYSVLSLLGSFLCLAVIYLLLGFPFLAATQLLVYAGAIMVLFLFVVMLLNLGDGKEIERNAGTGLTRRQRAVAVAAAGGILLVGALAAGPGEAFAAEGAAAGRLDELVGLAAVLFGRYMLPFEAASLLLLATMVAVIMLAKRERPGRAGAKRLGWPWKRGAAE